MRKVSMTEARADFESLVDSLRTGDPVVISRRGVESAMLVSLEDYEELRKLHPEWPPVEMPPKPADT